MLALERQSPDELLGLLILRRLCVVLKELLGFQYRTALSLVSCERKQGHLRFHQAKLDPQVLSQVLGLERVASVFLLQLAHPLVENLLFHQLGRVSFLKPLLDLVLAIVGELAGVGRIVNRQFQLTSHDHSHCLVLRLLR